MSFRHFSAHYTSGAYVDNNKAMHATATLRKVTILLESQWCNPIELVFEGVTTLNLRPPKDNYSADIFGASVFVKDETIFFFDSNMEELDVAYTGTWISAYSLRWKFTSLSK
jgi:hypothetical protein